MRRQTAIWPLALGIALAPGAVGAQTFTTTTIGHLDGCELGAQGMSADGSAVFGTIVPGGCERTETEGYRWNEIIGIVALGSRLATGASADGSVIVGELSPSQACRWTFDEGCVGLGFLPGPSPVGSVALDVSSDGTIVVGSSANQLGEDLRQHEAFWWTATEGMIALDDSPADYGWSTFALSVSDDGAVVFGAFDRNSPEKIWRWTSAEGLVSLEQSGLPCQNVQISAGSADGSTAVGTMCGGRGGPTQFWHWRESSQFTVLGVGIAQGVSADGSHVVGYFPPASGGAFLWDRTNGVQDLRELLTNLGMDLTGWGLRAQAISDDGRTIAGTGTNPDSLTAAWIATLDCPDDDDCDTVPDVDDNCPGLRTTDINDANDNGIGDMCECGDQTGDGHTNMADIMAMIDVIFEQQEASPLCDTDDDDQCDVRDILGVNAKLFGADAYCARYPAP